MIIEVAERLNTTKEYYFSVKLDEVRRMVAAGKNVINVAIGSPDMAPSAETINTLAESARSPENHGYQSYRSIPELREAISNWYKKTYQVDLDPVTEVLPLIGSKEGITHISLTFLNPGDEVLVPELGYPAYSAVTEMIGAKAIPFPMLENDGWKPDIQTIAMMNLNRVKLMWINYPNMPTGAAPSKEMFEALVAFAKKRQILLCHDNPYSLVLNREPPISLLSVPGAKAVALELNSMSKSHNMAGWRIGWVSGDKSYIDQIIKIKSNVDSGMFKPMQLAATEAFNNPDSWHTERNQVYASRKEIVYKILDKLRCTYDKNQVGMFVWAKIPGTVPSSEKLVDYLLHKHHVFIAPGFIFGQKGERYIRISLCLKNQMLEKVLERIQDIDLLEI